MYQSSMQAVLPYWILWFSPDCGSVGFTIRQGPEALNANMDKRNAGDQKGKKAATNRWHKSDKDQSAPQPNNAKEIKLQTISPGFCLNPVSCYFLPILLNADDAILHWFAVSHEKD